ncbi:unnamed protein product [Cylicocyclus nassatus]|uniref:Uncharacterized protein n=1 Tax=Cylicocyclus nassatus TaxID=53992 RepID=A0AA36HED3_CYLNA|nr:unnamed protein product [Cylicocyclus nassatus]
MEERYDSTESLSTNSYEDIEQRIILHVYDDESKEFTSLTTYHGMIRIYTSTTWPSRIFWSMVVVTCLTLFMIHSALMLLFYHSHPTFIKTTNMLLSDKYLPKITVCRSFGARQWMNYPGAMTFLIDKIKFIRRFEEIWKHKGLLYSFNAVLAGGVMNEDDIKNLALLENIFFETTKKKFNLENFLLQNRPKSKMACSAGHCQETQRIVTPSGYCSTYKWKPISSTLLSFRIDVVSEPDESLMFFVHPANSKPASSNGLHLRRGQIAKLVVQPKKKIHLKIGDWGNCMRDTAVHASSDYNRNGCELDCAAKHYEQQCECSPFFANHKTKRPCTLMETALYRGKEKTFVERCHCPLECEGMDYEYAALSYVKKRQRNVSTIEVQMQSRHVYVEEQLKRIKPVDLLSYVAGSMGLFLGMSCVTLLEIFIYLFKSVWGVFNDQRHKSYYLENLLGITDTSSNGSEEEIVITARKSPPLEDTHSSSTSAEEICSKPYDNEKTPSRVKIEIVHHPMGRRKSVYNHHLDF